MGELRSFDWNTSNSSEIDLDLNSPAILSLTDHVDSDQYSDAYLLSLLSRSVQVQSGGNSSSVECNNNSRRRSTLRSASRSSRPARPRAASGKTKDASRDRSPLASPKRCDGSAYFLPNGSTQAAAKPKRTLGLNSLGSFCLQLTSIDDNTRRPEAFEATEATCRVCGSKDIEFDLPEGCSLPRRKQSISKYARRLFVDWCKVWWDQWRNSGLTEAENQSNRFLLDMAFEAPPACHCGSSYNKLTRLLGIGSRSYSPADRVPLSMRSFRPDVMAELKRIKQATMVAFSSSQLSSQTTDTNQC
ncbi:unnamed protein product [Protopolystoma xenopodis]|uniref:Uncharacterized protein n=1 Tax=Protopolystoma xenopodis TaxID=117903 RepID=A0A3S5AET8_9PLAT|nr:unnamed protein product [Protopolystoma xenopodis]